MVLLIIAGLRPAFLSSAFGADGQHLFLGQVYATLFDDLLRCEEKV